MANLYLSHTQVILNCVLFLILSIFVKFYMCLQCHPIFCQFIDSRKTIMSCFILMHQSSIFRISVRGVFFTKASVNVVYTPYVVLYILFLLHVSPISHNLQQMFHLRFGIVAWVIPILVSSVM